MNKKEKALRVYVFNCPVHGEEVEVFCFRAGDMKNAYLWKKYAVTRREVNFDTDEFERLMEGFGNKFFPG